MFKTSNMQLLNFTHQAGSPVALDQARLRGAKRAYSTRCVDISAAKGMIEDGYMPKAGDLLLARVSRVGKHARIEQPDGRRSHLYAGDEILVCYGNRYAPDQFEGLVPGDLETCELVAAGGIAASVTAKHRAVSPATRIEPLGVLTDRHGAVMNLRDGALPVRDLPASCPAIVAVVGTAMNAGKTTMAARYIRGLVRAGKRVAAAKITGTGAGGDYWMMHDAGAEKVVDFVDAGFASTYGLGEVELTSILRGLISHLASLGVDVIVLELADGLLQKETRTLIAGSAYAKLVDQTMFAAADAMGAVAGYESLRQMGRTVSAISGAFTAAPLAVREVEQAVACPVYLKTDLSDPKIAAALLDEHPVPSRGVE